MKLLFRCRPISGESWPGYLLRLAAGNRYQGIVDIAVVLDMSATTLIASSPREILLRLGIEPPIDAGCLEPRKWKKPSLYLAGRSIHARVCSRCLNEMSVSHIRSSWDRLFEVTCSHHQIFLLETCPRCLQQISYLRKNVDQCDCGFRFARAKEQVIDIDTLGLLSVLNLHSIYASPAITFAFSGKQELGACVLIFRLNQLKDGLSKSFRFSQANYAYLSLDAIRQSLRWFEAWPQNFNQMTLRIQPGTGKTIGDLILGESLSNQKLFPTIRKALDNLNSERRGTPRPKRRCIQVMAHDKSDYVSIQFVMDVSGCSYDIAKYWIFKGWLGVVTTVPRKNGQIEHLISKTSVDKALQIIKATSSVQELSRTLGISALSLRTLARNQVLLSTPYGPGHWNIRLTHSEVFAFANRLLSNAEKDETFLYRRISIDDAISRLSARHPGLVKPLITALVQGHIPLWSFGHQPISLAELAINPIDLHTWRRKMRARKHEK